MKKIIRLFITIYIGLVPMISKGQSEIDSLKSLLDISSGEEKVRLFREITKFYETFNVDSALLYGQRGLALAERLEDEYDIAEFNRRLGAIHRENLDYKLAYEHLDKSIQLFEEIGSQAGLLSAYTSLANLANEYHLHDISLEHYNKALDILFEMGYAETVHMAQIYLNIGAVFSDKSDIEESNKYFQMALKIFEELNSYENLVPTYLNKGYNNELEGKYPEAESNYLKGLEYTAKSSNAKTDSIDVLLNLGRLYNELGRFNQAYEILTGGYSLVTEVGKTKNIRDYSKEIAFSLDSLGNHLEAFNFYKIYHDLDEEVRKDETDRLLSGKDLEIQIREQEITLRKSRIRNIMFLSGLGLSLIYMVLLFRNYRMKQKANRLLAEMDEMKSRLFSNISHEFRTPLTLILGPLEEMMEMKKKKKPNKKTVQMMQRNANRLLDLVNQMLDLSKVDAGSMKLELVEEEIFKTIRIYILSFASLAEKKKIKFSHTLPDDKLVTWFDPDKLEKTLNNLLSNAFKFTPEGGSVKVEVMIDTAASPQKMQIDIEDSGAGIPEEQLEKIFDRFHQVEEAAEFETVGTGIGLALTKELVEVMHGQISVASHVGKGTKFTLEIPLGKEHLKESEYIIKGVEEVEQKSPEVVPVADEEEYDEEISTEEEKELGFPMVLTVEDHEDIRTHIRENLEDCFRVMEAENGKLGLNKAIENIPDLIITDLMMPEMDGIELCKHLKTDERTSHIPVIMLTAKASVEDKLEGLETGADAYVTKPFNIKELRLRVTKLIEQRKKLRERFSREITIEPKDIAVTSADERFMQKAMVCVDEHMGDSDFDVRQFQDEMSMSRMQLFRKLKALTDHTPSEFIRNLRLKRAAKLIEGGFGNVAEVCYEVGFNNLSYFAKCFKELFKVLPSEYGKKTE